VFICYFECVGNWSGHFLIRTVNERMSRDSFAVEMDVSLGVRPRVTASCVIPLERRRGSHQELAFVIANCIPNVVIDPKGYFAVDAC
jgi:hypothetical protein